MRIVIAGGGPAGLYFALLMKKSFPDFQIEIFERNKPSDTFGWGVVFSDRTLSNFQEYDPPSYQNILNRFATWDNVDIVRDDGRMTVRGNKFSGIARIDMLNIFQQRCEELGVAIHFESELTDFDSVRSSCDLFVGADGVNSQVRNRYSEQFEPDLSVRHNRYIWFGTEHLFDALTLTFRDTPAGVFAAHSYKFNQTHSTFVVECSDETWRTAGLDAMSESESISFLEGIFEKDLGGKPLLSNNSRWINFLLVKNRHWHFDNTVLLGDALHTAHFSIGSGTKLALEDSIDLYHCFLENADVTTALKQFEMRRHRVVDEYQEAAERSLLLFENIDREIECELIPFAFKLMTRSKRVGREQLLKRDPEFVRVYDEWRSAQPESVN